MSRTFYAFVLMILSAGSTAFAQAPTGGAPAGGGAGAPGASPLMNLVPFIVMLGIMYLLMIRPQMKKQKQHQEFLVQLKRGDEVVTSSGILGRIEGLTDLFATLEIAPGVRIKILRSQIASSGAAVTASPGNKDDAKSEVKT